MTGKKHKPRLFGLVPKGSVEPLLHPVGAEAAFVEREVARERTRPGEEEMMRKCVLLSREHALRVRVATLRDEVA